MAVILLHGLQYEIYLIFLRQLSIQQWQIMSVGCKSLKVSVTDNFLPLQRSFILSVMTQMNIMLECLNVD